MARTRVASPLPSTAGHIHAPRRKTGAQAKRGDHAPDRVEQRKRTRVGVGSRVTLIERESMERVTLVVTGSTASDPERGRISCLSPLGRGLIGAEPGDIVDVFLGNLGSRFYVLYVSTGTR